LTADILIFTGQVKRWRWGAAGGVLTGQEEEEPYLRAIMMYVRSLDVLFCSLVPYLPLLLQGISALVFLQIDILDTD
jgi:hypothetical protein